MIQFACSECDADLEAAQGKAGQRLRCPECGVSVEVPRLVRRGVGARLWTLFTGTWSLALVLLLVLLVEGRDDVPPDVPPGPPVVVANGSTGDGTRPPETGKSGSGGPELPASANIPALVEGLQAPDPVYRAECATKLGTQGRAAASATPALIHCLNDKEESVRRAAMTALQRIGVPPTKNDVRELVLVLTSAAPEARLFSATALALIGPDARGDATAALVEATKDRSHPALRRQAYLSLGRITPTDRALLFPLIVTGSNDPNLEVRVAALQLLPGLAPPTANDVPALAEALTAQNQQVRRHAARCLLDLGPAAKGAVKALDNALSHADKQTAALAARALARIGPAANVAGPDLMNAAQDESDELARAAADALIALGLVTKKDVPHCITLLRDARPHTRLCAIQLLKKLGADALDAAPHLIQLVKSDPDRQVRIEAARSLAAFAPGFADTVPALIAVIKDSDGELRLAAVNTLGRYGSDAREALPTLESLLKNAENKPLLGEVATALAAISPDSRTANELKRIIVVPDNRELRTRIYALLTRLGKPAVPVLGELLSSTDRDLRLQAANALGAIGADARGNVVVLRLLAVHAGLIDAKVGDTDGEVKQACKTAYDKINGK